MIDNLQQWAEGLSGVVQWLAVMAAAMIPFVESYVGSAIGVIAGLPPALAIPAAVLGNVISMLALVLGADRLRRRRTRDDAPRVESARTQRVRHLFDRYGVAGVSLIGQTVLPSQVTSAALVSFGARTRTVVVWQVVSICLWGVVFGALASGGVNLVGA